MAEPTQVGWYFVENSWQYTTVYDADRVPICRLDLEDWGVTEDNQERLEGLQTSYAQLIAQAWTIPALRAATPDPARLELLADWFDRLDDDLGLSETDVQDDLRAWAGNIRAALALGQEADRG